MLKILINNEISHILKIDLFIHFLFRPLAIIISEFISLIFTKKIICLNPLKLLLTQMVHLK